MQPHSAQRNWGARVREYDLFGIRTVVLENELLRVGVAADRGTDICEFLFKPTDTDCVWLTANGTRTPKTLAAIGRDGDRIGAFLDQYAGGWQEILPNGGTPSVADGAPFGQHGEVCLLPWGYRIVEDSENAVAVEFTVACIRTPLRLAKTLRLARHSAQLAITEQLVNESPVDVRFMWGHHLAFGKPFLSPGARISLPDGIEATPDASLRGTRRVTEERFVWPTAVSPSGDSIDLSLLPPPGTPTEMIYLHGFPHPGWYELQTPALCLRAEWDSRVMPYLWLWQESGATRGYPWYGRHWNLGLEPFSSYPTAGLAEAVSNDSALTLGPNETLNFALDLEVRAA